MRGNGRQYLDVTFADPGGSGLDPGSITDPVMAEFTLSGSAAAGVVVDLRRRRRSAAARIAMRSAAALRKAPSSGLVFAVGSWQDTAQNVNLAESESFTVKGPDGLPPTATWAVPSPGSSILAGAVQRPPVPGRDVCRSRGQRPGPGLDHGPGAEFTLSGSAAAGVVVDLRGPCWSAQQHRYAFSGSFAEGPVQVDFAAGSWQDNAQNVNLAESESFNLCELLIQVTDATLLHIVSNNYHW